MTDRIEVGLIESLARGKFLEPAVRIAWLFMAVDPSVTERFVQGLRVRDRVVALVLFKKLHP